MNQHPNHYTDFDQRTQARILGLLCIHREWTRHAIVLGICIPVVLLSSELCARPARWHALKPTVKLDKWQCSGLMCYTSSQTIKRIGHLERRQLGQNAVLGIRCCVVRGRSFCSSTTRAAAQCWVPDDPQGVRSLRTNRRGR